MATKLSKIEVTTRFIGAHGDKYDYSKVDFINVSTHVDIICPQHGVFKQTPHKHIQGRGCPQCAKIRRGESCIKPKSISDLHVIHGVKYMYPDFKHLTRLDDYIKVECRVHGEFTIRMKNHMSGQGCAKCSHLSNGGAYHRMSPEERSLIVGGFLYKLKLYNKCELFYKVGITINPNLRLKPSKFSPYQMEVITIEKFSTLDEAYRAERLSLSKVERYTPIHRFDGYTECYHV